MLVATVQCLHLEGLYSFVEESVLYYQGSGEPLEDLRVGVNVCVMTIFLLLQFFFVFSPQNCFSDVELLDKRGQIGTSLVVQWL